MRLLRGFFLRHHRRPDEVEGSVPSGYYTPSGFSPGYVRLISYIDDEYGDVVTPELISQALQAAAPRVAAAPRTRRRAKAAGD